ncbi:ABC1-domain-containing protein [Xylariaceae sp. FL1272]|nr:ABC1-domain-containing protein [Xylariaceae sp. FL1272]
MRFADVILDLAAVAKASRSVASKHLELRAGQIERYGRTSSIVRSLRDATAQAQAQSRRPDETGKAPGTSTTGTQAPYEASRPEASRNLFQHDQSPVHKSTVQPPDQSEILSRIRDNDKASHDAKPAQQEDVPSDVNINIFHTNRGSSMVDGAKGLGLRLNPKVPVSTPSWFKDFGHDKPKEDHQPAKPLPSISNVGRSPLEQSAVEADVAIASPVMGNLAESETKTETEPPKGSQDANAKEPTSKRIEEENIQAVKEILGREEAKTAKEEPVSASAAEPEVPAYVLRESKVPATRLSRIWNYSGLAAGMLGGAITEGFSRGFGGGGQGSVMFSAGNMERLVAKLSRMRGAALKLGQMMSFQDSKMLPAPIREVLQRVQDRADYMPAWQRDRVLTDSLGPEWRDLFGEFEETPIAAASIGQVHRATLKTGEKVAVKIQFPGVADSINSDLDNLSMLLTASKMLPKGLYLNKTIDNARVELGWECDYERELECGKKYKSLLENEGSVFAIPEIYAHASGKHVLTMQFMEGVGVTRVKSFTQEQRDWIGTQILRLCLREIAEFRFMQTDPNWTNFLYNAETNKLELLDFGASREFPEEFVAQYLSLLAAAARRDREAVIDFSQRLGYLTGHESRTMLDAHVASILTLAEPFLQSAPEVYDFADQTITERVRDLIPVMVRERLSPPPEETYSLHRKLSGAFLLCARLGSRVACRGLFDDALKKTDLYVVR